MNAVELLPSLPTGASILFIRLRRLGDTILSTPLYAALKSWRPDLRLAVLVESPCDEVLRNNPDLDEVIAIPTSRKGVLGRFAVRCRILKRIRNAGFDCCINLHGGPTSAWLTALSGALYRAGGPSFRNRLTCNIISDTPRMPPDGRRPHAVEYGIGSLRNLGLPEGPIPALRLAPDPARRRAALRKLEDLGLDSGRGYAVIQPTCKYHTKEWRAEGFAAIADEIRTGYGLPVAILGGPGEDGKVKAVATKCRSAPVVVWGLSVSELIWAIRGARLFVGNDSGPTHIAAALGVPIIVLFGSSDSQAWHPWKTKSPYRIVQNKFACNPCRGNRCLVYDTPRCILSIPLDHVRAAVAAQLRLSTHLHELEGFAVGADA